MLTVSFNQDSTCFVCGTDRGFVVYNCDPPTERFNRFSKNVSEANGIGIIESMFKSNIFALVGGGDNPKYPENTVMIWDDYQSKCIAELEFKSNITGVKMRRDIILISISEKTYLYKFSDLQLIKSIETCNNEAGISATSLEKGNVVVAVPGKDMGTVTVDHHTTGKNIIVNAHDNPIARISLNKSGDKLATVSNRGTLIRVWDTLSGKKIREFRRGVDPAAITSLTFNKDSSRLLACSNKGTVHIFSLQEEVTNTRSNLIYISDYLPEYFSSEWSVVSFRVPENSVCSFGGDNNIYIITDSGDYFKYTYNLTDTSVTCVESEHLPIIQ